MILLLIHLTIADLCVILVDLPLEIAWTATVSWWADEVTCKLMVFLRVFGYFISSNVLMAISIDRFSAIVFPIAHRTSVHRTRWLLLIAWVLALLFSAPQSFLFVLAQHPIVRDYHQCMNRLTLPGYTPSGKTWELTYFLYFFALSWVLPVLVMTFCYSSIIITIARRSKLPQLHCLPLVLVGQIHCTAHYITDPQNQF